MVKPPAHGDSFRSLTENGDNHKSFKHYIMKTVKTLFGVIIFACLSMGVEAQENHNKTEIAKHAISHEKLLERLLKYLSVESYSKYDNINNTWTMTPGQEEMATLLAEEAKKLGAEVYHSPDNYVYVTVQSNLDYEVPTVGISCHLDYSEEAPGENITPIVTRYKGGDIELSPGIILSPDTKEGRDLNTLVGKTIIHTDGTTLLGGDCKNGCAASMSILETLLKSDIKHGKVQFVWCPNEDIGKSAERIDTAYFKPEIFYDLDGEGNKEVGVANFTARGLIIRFTGKYAHPGEAKAMGLGDALAAACQLVSAIPLDCRPEHSEGTQGYMQAYGFIQEGIDWCVKLRLRYFDVADGERYDMIIKNALESIKRDHPNVGIKIAMDNIEYENVAYSLHSECLPSLMKAASSMGKDLDLLSNRGGTTAAMMAAKGLRGGLVVFSGQHAIHSVYEYSVLEEIHDIYMLMLNTIDEVSRLR